MENQDLYVIWKLFSIIKFIMSMLYLVLYPLILEKISNYEGEKYVAEVGDKSNNYSSHIVNVDIPQYKVQKMNVNHFKDNLRKRKTSAWYKALYMKHF